MTTQKFNKIDVSKLSVGKIKDGTKMRTFFIDYENKLFSVQTPQLMLDWGGIPKEDQYHLTDADRQYVLYGSEPQPSSKTHEADKEYKKRSNDLNEFEAWLISIEEWVNSDSVQKKLFGGKESDFIPLVRGGTGGAPNKVKFKFYTDRDAGDPDFELCKHNTETKTRDFELTSGMSLTDLRKKVFQYMGKQRLIFQIRGWTDKIFEKSKKAPRFGLTLTIKAVEYTPVVKREPSATPPAEVSFIDSDEELDDDIIRRTGLQVYDRIRITLVEVVQDADETEGYLQTHREWLEDTVNDLNELWDDLSSRDRQALDDYVTSRNNDLVDCLVDDLMGVV